MARAAAVVEDRFEQFLGRLGAAVAHADRREPLRAYLAGLLLPGERKSVEPMAAKLDTRGVCARHQSMHHFVAGLRLPELQARFAEIVGEPTRSPNKKFLLRRIGEALDPRAREAAAAPQTDTPTTPARIRLTKLSVAELQSMYREVVGRDTSSTDSACLVWKVRQARRAASASGQSSVARPATPPTSRSCRSA